MRGRTLPPGRHPGRGEDTTVDQIRCSSSLGRLEAYRATPRRWICRTAIERLDDALRCSMGRARRRAPPMWTRAPPLSRASSERKFARRQRERGRGRRNVARRGRSWREADDGGNKRRSLAQLDGVPSDRRSHSYDWADSAVGGAAVREARPNPAELKDRQRWRCSGRERRRLTRGSIVEPPAATRTSPGPCWRQRALRC